MSVFVLVSGSWGLVVAGGCSGAAASWSSGVHPDPVRARRAGALAQC
jgi:hypothetical protein